MSFFDDASLAFLPSSGAGKDGKAYSIKPTTGDGDFTFSRGSNLAATRVGADGLIEKGRENLVTRSNELDLWNIRDVTGGHAGYDGTNDAWLQSGIGRLQRNLSLSSSVYTGSVYVKAGFSDYVQLYLVGSSNALARFQLTGSGTIVNSGGISPKIEPVSGATGWYRISTNLNGSITTFRIYPQNDSSGTQTADSSVYVQDAQLELGLAATDVIETGATTGKAGLLEDDPRFDYSGGATCPSLLLEPSRTQLYGYSEYSGIWNKTNWTTTDNYAISPEGVQNAFRAVSTNNSGILYLSGTGTTGQDNTLSVWAKSNTGADQKFRFWGNGNTTTSSDFTATTEWQRFDYTYNCTFITAGIKGASSELSDILFYGFQHEAGSYPTSYIPNHSGGSVTRGAEGRNYSGFSSLIGQTEGTLFLDIENAENNTEIFSLNRSTINSIFLLASSGVYRAFIYSDGTTVSQLTSINVSDRIKIAIAYQSNNFAIYANGSQVWVDSTLNWTPNVAIDLINFNNGGYVSSKGVARYNQVLLFKEALSDTELIKLTTI